MTGHPFYSKKHQDILTRKGGCSYSMHHNPVVMHSLPSLTEGTANYVNQAASSALQGGHRRRVHSPIERSVNVRHRTPQERTEAAPSKSEKPALTQIRMKLPQIYDTRVGTHRSRSKEMARVQRHTLTDILQRAPIYISLNPRVRLSACRWFCRGRFLNDGTG